MTIKYNILWIENDSDWQESICDDIRDFIEEQGFELNVKVIAQQTAGTDYNRYDLILMDLNLADAPSGDELIQQIRSLGVYTDVVFYSAGGIETIKLKGKERDLEGVYYSGRNRDLFLSKVQSVIQTTIRKVQDLNNLRGLVMSEVSELDALMEQIIESFFVTDERIKIFHEHVTSNREKSIKKSLTHPNPESCDKKCVLTLRDKNIEEILKIIDSSQKAHAINEVLKEVNQDGHFGFADGKFYQSYESEIILVRNNLAHCDSYENNGQEVLRTRKGDLSFNTEDFVLIRKNISKYNKLFTQLLEI